MQPQADEIINHYTRLTGREARLCIYERVIWEFLHAGFTPADFETVLKFLISENKKAHTNFKFSLKLGHILSDHVRFCDSLSEAKARNRNRVLPPTPRQSVLQSFSPVVTEGTVTMTARKLSDFLKVP